MILTDRIIRKYAYSDRYDLIIRGNEYVVLDKEATHYREQLTRTVDSLANGDSMKEIAEMNKAFDDLNVGRWWL